VQAFDLLVAQQLNPRPEYFDAILMNLNYEGGCNPVNVTFVTGLGWKRQLNIVDQYSVNDRRAMPKDGIPIANIHVEFFNTGTYGAELSALPFPSDYAETAKYPYYDRWCDTWNVSTESSSCDTARSLAVSAWLAAQTPLTNQSWRFTNAAIVAPPNPRLPDQPVTVTLQVADPNLSGARIIWEARDEEPTFGGTSYTFSPGPNYGDYWVEAEVQWPDGRRAFATNTITVVPDAPPQLSNPRRTVGGFVFTLAGTWQVKYVIDASTNLTTWQPIATNVIPGTGAMDITDPQSIGQTRRYYRAHKY
jgi:hypothetical protein